MKVKALKRCRYKGVRYTPGEEFFMESRKDVRVLCAVKVVRIIPEQPARSPYSKDVEKSPRQKKYYPQSKKEDRPVSMPEEIRESTGVNVKNRRGSNGKNFMADEV